MRTSQTSICTLALAFLCWAPQAHALNLLDYFTEGPTTGSLLGDSTLGNGWDLDLTFTNTSGFPIEIYSVGPGPIVDPNDLGIADVEVANALAARAALEVASPGYEAYATAHAEGVDPPTKNWVLFELDSVIPGPFTVAPGGTLDLELLIRNDSFGPDFTAPITNVNVGQANAAGEAVMAYDIDFRVVPEPASFTMLLLSAVGLAWCRHR